MEKPNVHFNFSYLGDDEKSPCVRVSVDLGGVHAICGTLHEGDGQAVEMSLMNCMRTRDEFREQYMYGLVPVRLFSGVEEARAGFKSGRLSAGDAELALKCMEAIDDRMTEFLKSLGSMVERSYQREVQYLADDAMLMLQENTEEGMRKRELAERKEILAEAWKQCQ